MATYVLGAIGSYFGPVGGMIGSAIGAMIDYKPPPDVEGPRLTDLKVTSSAYGSVIPILYGTARMNGNVIWSTDIIETKNEEEVGGKGGGGQKVTTYTYAISMAIGLCEGPIVGVKRIWANGKLIYSAAADADASTIIASNKSITGIRVYTGLETQQPDALIQSYEGVGSTPAYRGLAYLLFDNFQLADFGNVVPNIEIEVVQNGAVSNNIRTLASNYTPGIPYKSWYTGNYLITGFDGGVMRVTQVDTGTVNKVYLFDRDLQYIGLDSRDELNEYIFPKIITDSASGTTFYYIKTIIHQQLRMVVWYANISGTSIYRDKYVLSLGDPSQQVLACLNDHVPAGKHYAGYAMNPSGSEIMIFWRDVAWAEPGFETLTGWRKLGFEGIGFPMNVLAEGTFDTSTPTGLTAGISIAKSFVNTSNVDYSGGMFASGVMEESGNQIWGPFGVAYIGSDNVIRWKAWRTASWYSMFDYPTGGWFADNGVCAQISCGWGDNSNNRISIVGISPSVVPGTITLASVVEDLCYRGGVPLSQIDVTELMTDYVDGYYINNHGNARSAIEPLMQVYFFEAIESSGKIKFVKRGKSPIASIPYDDVAAHDGAAINELPDDVKFTRGADIEVPAEIDVSYWDKATDYQIGTQYSRRTTTYHENVQNVSLPMVLSSSKAAQVSEVLLYDAWVARDRFEIEVGQKWAHLDPCDVIIVNRNGISVTARIINMDAGGNGIVRISLVKEDSYIYNSSATGVDGKAGQGDNIRLPGPTRCVFLDVPALRDSEALSTPVIYIATDGYTADWKGASLFESTDLKTWGYNGIQVDKETIIGVSTDALGTFASGFIVDELNSVTVNIVNGELTSVTLDQLLNGKNRAVLGTEIIGFRDATLVSAGTYKLTGLLRGLLGTESEMCSHAIGDTFVLLEASKMTLMKDEISDIDVPRYIKAVSYGQTIAGTTPKTVTNTAKNLMPYAPALLNGNKQASGEFQFSWVRRTRYGGDWKNYADAPLGEVSEQYLVEIGTDSTFGTIKRSFYTSTTSAIYTTEAQTADFGATQSSIWVRVRQISDIVGPGFAAIKQF